MPLAAVTAAKRAGVAVTMTVMALIGVLPGMDAPGLAAFVQGRRAAAHMLDLGRAPLKAAPHSHGRPF